MFSLRVQFILGGHKLSRAPPQLRLRTHGILKVYSHDMCVRQHTGQNEITVHNIIYKHIHIQRL